MSRFHLLHHTLEVPRGLFHAMHRFRVPLWSNHDFGCVQALYLVNDGSKHFDFLRDEACQLLWIALLQDLWDLRLWALMSASPSTSCFNFRMPAALDVFELLSLFSSGESSAFTFGGALRLRLPSLRDAPMAAWIAMLWVLRQPWPHHLCLFLFIGFFRWTLSL